jgi:hypothetical protein
VLQLLTVSLPQCNGHHSEIVFAFLNYNIPSQLINEYTALYLAMLSYFVYYFQVLELLKNAPCGSCKKRRLKRLFLKEPHGVTFQIIHSHRRENLNIIA